MDCPICHKINLPDHTQFCPSCETDLFQFSLYNITKETMHATKKEHSVLSGKVVELSQKLERLNEEKVSKKFAWLFALSFLAAAYFGYKYFSAPPIIDDNPALKNEILDLKEKLAISAKENQLNQNKLAKVTTKEMIYITQPKDNLWKIAELFFNDAEMRFQIAKDNGIDISNYDAIPVGDTLIINLFHYKKQ